jgi:hypothetical protein
MFYPNDIVLKLEPPCEYGVPIEIGATDRPTRRHSLVTAPASALRPLAEYPNEIEQGLNHGLTAQVSECVLEAFGLCHGTDGDFRWFALPLDGEITEIFPCNPTPLRELVECLKRLILTQTTATQDGPN